MSLPISPNTQAILLLTAPLIASQNGAKVEELLTPGEYRRLARRLREIGRAPSDLLLSGSAQLLRELNDIVPDDRVGRLLDRGFLISQAVERWQARAIWVLSRADSEYPRKMKNRLKEDSPAVLYGCGQAKLLDYGGLAIVGSRHVDEPLIEYAEAVGRQCAVAKKGVISGGAQGIDRAAMRGALDAGGRVTGILADSLERTALNRENRSWLLDEQLVLISPYDPSAGFNVGHAMQRNKLIYGLADAALVVTADYEKGGTWTGAVEQLQKLRFVPIYVRSTGEIGRGLEALSTIGARPWPNPRGTDELLAMFDESDVPLEADQRQLTFQTPPVTPEESKGTQMDSSDEIAGNIPKLEKVQEEESTPNGEQGSEIPHSSLCNSPSLEPARMLIECVRDILVSLLRSPKDEGEIAEVLQVTTAQARTWLQKLVDEEVLEKRSRPVRYSVRQKKLL